MAGSQEAGSKVARHGGNLFTVLSATALIATEAFATAVAAGWALAGLLNLGDVGEYALMGLFSLAAAYVSFVYFRRAVRVEASLVV
ncbi:hypothetical protein [Xanthobacter versatilis]|uniref:Uncharacterized protein n=1 Tax=Xanthobacter autotrophicus (strain ATCC BAA-1158 / Py2) TaxID=78245 RepID=A7IBQ6_XANP2|nr:putative exported protein of unknown function [Xanthobacter autotrophicus Py2]